MNPVFRGRSGFSLTELMVTLVISIVVLGGLMASFSRINQSTRDASRSNDMTVSMNGLSTQLRHDFANAAKGLSDMSAMNIKYRFTPGFVAEVNNGNFFYGVTNHVEDGNGFSSITLQWFDYDLVGAEASTTPSFVFTLPGGGNAWPGQVVSGLVHSNNEDDLNLLQEGDVFLVYQTSALTQNEAYQREDGQPAAWNNPALNQPGTAKTDALLVQVSAMGGVEASSLNLAFQRELQFTPAGDNMFDNDFPGGSIDNVYAETGPQTLPDLGLNAQGDGDNKFAVQADIIIARRLSPGTGFHRVRYEVDLSGVHPNTGQTVPTLLRFHNNDTPEVIAVGVTQFRISLGMDVDPSSDPGLVLLADMDGAVSVRDTLTTWADSAADLGVSEDNYRIIIGRHAMVARVDFGLETLTSNLVKDSGTPDKQARSFSQQFKINTTLPTPYL
ncbi:Prepilin-type N-terminal cleavage/methylation domain-containing protein [Sulfidibacter corallicola]|uniref:Prepilin-type N-terminal cleavage/methylation domain-containing protein n=1 Tax=Sulfidibacter corallicola TaxID=2818388 RepID=A0A8A4TSP8_SULCO|nr:prepilin-type N-terminal cleavage/methylation domain-containing protein [Sulfidibacter corallicola]QTD52082.1 prepilin-type N-terminal cleavage/methylation domain-containing protein [Sulfidibacter corallicola]